MNPEQIETLRSKPVYALKIYKDCFNYVRVESEPNMCYNELQLEYAVLDCYKNSPKYEMLKNLFYSLEWNSKG